MAHGFYFESCFSFLSMPTQYKSNPPFPPDRFDENIIISLSNCHLSDRTMGLNLLEDANI